MVQYIAFQIYPIVLPSFPLRNPQLTRPFLVYIPTYFITYIRYQKGQIKKYIYFFTLLWRLSPNKDKLAPPFKFLFTLYSLLLGDVSVLNTWVFISAFIVANIILGS